MIRRYSVGRDRAQDYRRRPGAYAVILDGNACLLTCQQSPSREWQLPGGGLDPGETPSSALRREVVEETGWKVATVRRLGVFRRFTFMPEYGFWAEKLCHVYLARALRQLGPPSEIGHHAAWMPIGQAMRVLANDGDAAFLQLAATRSVGRGRNRRGGGA